MADVSAELRTYLAGISAINTLVGSGDDARIFHHYGRQGGALPFLILDEGGGQPSHTLTGATGLAQASFRIWAIDDDKAGATALWEAVRVNLDRFDGDWNTVTVVEVVMANWRDCGIWRTQDRSEDWLYYCVSVYDIWHVVPALAT